VHEGYAAAVDLSRAAAHTFGWLDRNTGATPLTLEAKKTVAFEVREQLGGRLPDLMIAPVGDGPTLVALDKGGSMDPHDGCVTSRDLRTVRWGGWPLAVGAVARIAG
jgi:threonine synthase